MEKFTLQVANELAKEIHAYSKHLDEMKTLFALRKKANENMKDKAPPWIKFSNERVDSSVLPFVSKWLPMQEETLVACYIDRVKKEIEEREYSLQQLNDSCAQIVNAKWNLFDPPKGQAEAV